MTSNYPGFDYKANELSKFLASSDIFTIILKSGKLFILLALGL